MNNLFIDICPDCHKRSDYKPNPAYIHICKRCKFECSQSDLIQGIDVKNTIRDINELKDQIDYLKNNLKEYPNYYSDTEQLLFNKIPAKNKK